MNNKSHKMLEVKNLSKYFLSRQGVTKAIDDISFSVDQGEIVGLIGQSGSGKSTTGNAIMRLLTEVNGIIALDGKVVSGKISKQTKKEFTKKAQMIFQNPYTALNDKHNIFSTLAEPLKVNGIIKGETNKFLKNWKENVSNFKYTFKLEYLNKEFNFMEFRTMTRRKMLENVAKNLQTCKSPEEVISTVFLPIKEYESLINKKMSKMTEELIQIYIVGNNKILDNDIHKSEKVFIEAKNKFEKTKNLKKRHDNLIALPAKLKEERDQKIKNDFRDTHNLLKSLVKDREKRINFYKQLAGISRTNVIYNKRKAQINKAKTELLAISFIAKHKLIADFKTINKYDEYIFDVANPVDKLGEIIIDLKKRTSEHIANVKKQYKNKFVKAQKSLISFENKLNKKLAKLDEDPNTALKLYYEAATIKFEKAQIKYKEYVAKARITPEQDIKSMRGKFKQAKFNKQTRKNNQLQKEIMKLASKKINEFKSYEKDNVASTKEHYKEVKKQIWSENSSLKTFEKERTFLVKGLVKTKVLLGMKKTSSKRRYQIVKKILLKRIVFQSLEEVGLKAEHAYRYPHEFSGGQLQRVVIAKALIVKPKLIIADEPIASLDVSIQAQVINILTTLAKQKGISLIFIGHDISVIEYIADKMLVMHLGKIVEAGKTESIFKKPIHPYTKTLFDAVPKLSNANEDFKSIEIGEDYRSSYDLEMPKMRKAKANHYVYANKTQIKKWSK